MLFRSERRIPSGETGDRGRDNDGWDPDVSLAVRRNDAQDEAIDDALIVEARAMRLGIIIECEAASWWPGEPVVAMAVDHPERLPRPRTLERVAADHPERLQRPRTRTGACLRTWASHMASRPSSSARRGLSQSLCGGRVVIVSGGGLGEEPPEVEV